MNKTRLLRPAALTIFTLFPCALAAQAQSPQAFVSVSGVDNGSGKPAAHCHTFK